MKVSKSFEIILISGAMIVYAMALDSIAAHQLAGAAFWLLIFALFAAVGMQKSAEFAHESFGTRFAFGILLCCVVFVLGIIGHFLANAAHVRFFDPALHYASRGGLYIGAIIGVVGLVSGIKSVLIDVPANTPFA